MDDGLLLGMGLTRAERAALYLSVNGIRPTVEDREALLREHGETFGDHVHPPRLIEFYAHRARVKLLAAMGSGVAAASDDS